MSLRPSAISSNQQDIRGISQYPVDDAIRLEEYLEGILEQDLLDEQDNYTENGS